MAKALTVQELIQRGASRRAQRVTIDELKQLKVASWDIEASGLNADFGIILCGSVKTLGEKEIRTYRIDDAPTYKKEPWNDCWVAERLAEDLEEHDVVIHHYGDRYDIPFLNTRLIGHRKPMLDSSKMAFVDTWLNIRKRFKLHSNRLMSLISYLETKTQKTGLDGNLWTKATAGHRPSLDKVIEHNIHDVKALEETVMTLVKFYALRYTYVK